MELLEVSRSRRGLLEGLEGRRGGKEEGASELHLGGWERFRHSQQKKVLSR